MSDMEFRELVLSAITELKKTIERVEDRIDARLTNVEKDISSLRSEVKETIERDVKRTIERVEDSMDRMNERTHDRLAAVDKEVSDLRSDIKRIRGKLEGR